MLQDKKHLKQIQIYRGFLKWWYPTTMGFPTKNHHLNFGVFWVPPFKERPISTIPSKQTSSHVLPSTVEICGFPRLSLIAKIKEFAWPGRSSRPVPNLEGSKFRVADLSVKPKPLADIPSLKLTFSHLKMDGWNMIFSFWVSAYFQVGTVSFRECKP